VSVSVWQRPEPANGFGVLLGALKAYGRFDIPLPHGPDIFQFGDPGRMKQALTQSGFDHIDAKPVPQSMELKTATGLVDAALQGSVRMKTLHLAQDKRLSNQSMLQLPIQSGSYFVSKTGYSESLCRPSWAAAPSHEFPGR
jgi:hypothetical protein